MTHRLPHDDESQHGFWTTKTPANLGSLKKVVVAHQDVSAGESIALLLGLKGFSSLFASDLVTSFAIIKHWRPDAILIDTRMENRFEYAFTHALLANPETSRIFALAMCDFATDEPVQAIKDAGYDAMCRRPCPVWKLADLLNQYFLPPPTE